MKKSMGMKSSCWFLEETIYKGEIKMTLLELQNILGERIKIATDENMKPQDRMKANE